MSKIQEVSASVVMTQWVCDSVDHKELEIVPLNQLPQSGNPRCIEEDCESFDEEKILLASVIIEESL